MENEIKNPCLICGKEVVWGQDGCPVVDNVNIGVLFGNWRGMQHYDCSEVEDGFKDLKNRPCYNCKEKSGSIADIPLCSECYTASKSNTEATEEYKLRYRPQTEETKYDTSTKTYF